MRSESQINPHLNLFRFFNEDSGSQFIENNLSRALALCLKLDSRFLAGFIQEIVTPDDSEYILENISSSRLDLDIQKKMSDIEAESFKAVYAVAITGDQKLDMTDFLNQQVMPDRDHHITDIWFSIKDVAFVVEVKTTLEDCKAQLYNQILPFINLGIRVVPKSLPWQRITNLMEEADEIKRPNNESLFIRDFLLVSESRYPEWFRAKPFSQLQFNALPDSNEFKNLMKRMSQCVSETQSYEQLDYRRTGLSLPWTWASELIPWFSGNKKDQCVAFTIWPGNTKAQGEKIYNKSLDWTKKTSLKIDGRDFKMVIGYDIKFAHFNKFVANVYFPMNEVQVLILPHTPENYYQYSGRWERNIWSEFENFMDKHFALDFNWRSRINWDENFRYTDRKYFTISLGFEVTVYVPFEEFKKMDRNPEDVSRVSEFIRRVADAFSTLTE